MFLSICACSPSSSGYRRFVWVISIGNHFVQIKAVVKVLSDLTAWALPPAHLCLYFSWKIGWCWCSLLLAVHFLLVDQREIIASCIPEDTSIWVNLLLWLEVLSLGWAACQAQTLWPWIPQRSHLYSCLHGKGYPTVHLTLVDLGLKIEALF